MATNQYFNNYKHINEQNLFESLVIESIKMYGVDMIYLPRQRTINDEVLNENRNPIFSEAYDIEMYVKSADSFSGEGDFISKFGLQINDQAIFTVSIKVFNETVTSTNPSINRPFEGDLIFFPFNQKLLKIMHVEHESVFYQNGKLQVYDIKCELMEYSGEKLQTGRSVIDNMFNDYSTSSIDTMTELKQSDPFAKNVDFADEMDNILDMSEVDPLQEIISRPVR